MRRCYIKGIPREFLKTYRKRTKNLNIRVVYTIVTFTCAKNMFLRHCKQLIDKGMDTYMSTYQDKDIQIHTRETQNGICDYVEFSGFSSWHRSVLELENSLSS